MEHNKDGSFSLNTKVVGTWCDRCGQVTCLCKQYQEALNKIEWPAQVLVDMKKLIEEADYINKYGI